MGWQGGQALAGQVKQAEVQGPVPELPEVRGLLGLHEGLRLALHPPQPELPEVRGLQWLKPVQMRLGLVRLAPAIVPEQAPLQTSGGQQRQRYSARGSTHRVPSARRGQQEPLLLTVRFRSQCALAVCGICL